MTGWQSSMVILCAAGLLGTLTGHAPLKMLAAVAACEQHRQQEAQ